MEWIIVLIVMAVIVLALVKPPKGKSYSYRQRGVLFTKAEILFLSVLDQSVSDRYRILWKVRVADVITPTNGMDRKRWQIAFNRISAKHFDYVLCKKDTFEIVAVIELDDKSHTTKKAIARDLLLESACESAKLKLIRFPAKSSYQVQAVRESLKQALNPVANQI